MATPTELAALDRAKYALLTTYRRDGSAVPTPVWFAVDGDRLLVWTDDASGKAKRLRNDPSATITTCDARGRGSGGPVYSGTVAFLDEAGRQRMHDLLNRKYGLFKRGYEAGMEVNRRLRRQPKGQEAGLAIHLD